jgi:epidermal growth factor receptor
LQDEKEMIRNLASAMDGPEALVEADEYLQPKCRAPLPPNLLSSSTSGSSPPGTPVKSCWPNGASLGTDSPTPQNQQNWDRELLRYGAALMHGSGLVVGNPNLGHGSSTSHEGTNSMQRSHYAHPNGHCGQLTILPGSDTGSSRYCSDPLKMVGVRGELFLNASTRFNSLQFASIRHTLFVPRPAPLSPPTLATPWRSSMSV